MKDFASRFGRRALGTIATALRDESLTDQAAMLSGNIAARQARAVDRIGSLADVEFRVFSQWGEDGIIEWLVHHLGDVPESFIEFGVETYHEANTRFLLQNRNWRGLVIDGSANNIAHIKNDGISWRHDLTAVDSFITSENIDEIITTAGFAGELGLLSIDIDGNDYWVWERISCVQPHIVVAEYNSAFGDVLPLTVPYRPDFIRSAAHHSNLYYGASIRALEQLGQSRGYVMIGTNLAGSNVFFVRQDRTDLIERVADRRDRPSRFREARDWKGNLIFLPPAERAGFIGALPVVDVRSGKQQQLAQCGTLFSERWQALLRGRQAQG